MLPYNELRKRLADSYCPWTLTKPGNHERWELPGGLVFILPHGASAAGHARQNYLKQIERAEVAYLRNSMGERAVGAPAPVPLPVPSPIRLLEPQPLPMETVEPAPMPVVTASIIAGQSVNAVNARDLHAFLEVGRDFSSWIRDRITTFGFQEHRDFEIFDSPVLGNQTGRGGDRRSKEYILSLDMAKELSMVERNEKGKQARQYFLDCEKKLTLNFQAPVNPFLNMSEEEWLEYTLLQLREKKEKEAVINHQQQTIGCQAEEIQVLTEVAEETSAQLERIAGAPIGSLSLWEAAKHLKVSPGWFNDWLRSIQWIYRGPLGTPLAYQPAINSGWITHTVREYEKGPSYKMVVITPAGLVKLAEMLGRRGR